MILHLLPVGVLLILFKPSLQISGPDSPSYVGAVVEYHPVTDGDDGQMIAEANANNYLTIIKEASSKKVDIIVFPEFGLTSVPKDGPREKSFNASEYRAYYRDTASYVPSPNETVVLCKTDTKYKKSLQSISCAAQEYQMYVVVNHHERVDCQPPNAANCSPDGFLLYNTNVVFDRKGQVVARYRKYNLFNEAGTNITAQPETSTFRADFGVTFGQYICFDMLNEKPSQYFAKNPNVTDVLYSTHWFDELPFHVAVQEQAAWAYAADVNLLAACYSDGETASGGSGIYAGRNGPIKIYKQPGNTSNVLVVAEIPKLDRRNRVEDARAGKSIVHVFKQAEVPTVPGGNPPAISSMEGVFKDDLKPYTTSVLDPKQGSHITTLCDRGMCCDFHVETSYDEKLATKPGAKEYSYRLAVFNGVRNILKEKTAGVEVCALISCTGPEIEDCNTLYPDSTDVVRPTRLESLIITRHADLTSRVFYTPTTLTRDFQPLTGGRDFAYLASGHSNSSLLLMYLVRPSSEVLTFGIYGRKYDRDGQEVTKPASPASREIGSTLLIALAVLLVLGVSRSQS